MIGALANHLWQSTIFAIVAGLVTLAFRNNRAQVRYWLWLSASLKFLLPFSLLMSLGNRLEWAPSAPPVPAASAVTVSIVQMSQPFRDTLLPVSSVPKASRNWPSIAIFGLWVFGFSGVALIRFRGWRRIRAALHSSTLMNIPAPIAVRSSPGLLEPGVVGFFRPVLLVPAGIAERLKPREWEAVLAHELCHARRRDNLTAAIHMIVEALFWFHPLVWWIGARLIEERERACDEAVLTLGSEAADYTAGILGICKSYFESPIACVSGVTGSDLKKRIQLILTGRVGSDLNFSKKFALVAAGIAALVMPIVAGITGVSSIRAQSPLVTPRFETASVKPCEAFRENIVPDHYSPGSLLQSQCTTVERLIQQAYGLFANGQWNLGSSLEVTGGPAWTRSGFYEVEAKAASPENRATLNGPMLQTLLEDRFKLKLHRESREIPVYALTVAEGGPKLQPFQGNCIPRDFDKPPSDTDCGAIRGWFNEFDMKAATIADLCAGFSVLLDRQVLDQTGIAGRFNMHLDMSSEDRELLNRPRSLHAVSNPTAPPPPPVHLDAANIAMKKLGLNLQAAKGPGEFLVIDHLERPSGN
jgi:bla regulator protein BlaR1